MAAAAAAVGVRQWTGLFLCSAFLWITAIYLPNGCVLRLAAARRLPASRRRRRSPGPQVNGAFLHCISDVVRVLADLVALWSMAMTRGKVMPPAENGFITFRRLSPPLARGPPTRARLNGDDRM